MLMLVMAKVRDLGRTGFVLAIRRRARPDGLERQQNDHQQENEAAHGGHYSHAPRQEDDDSAIGIAAPWPAAIARTTAGLE